MMIATHGAPDFIDRLYTLASFDPVLQTAACALMLFAVVRLWQVEKTVGRLNAGWGLVLLIVSGLVTIAISASLLELRYSPAAARYARDFGHPSPGDQWAGWEIWVWWGRWACQYAGLALVTLGLVKEARRLVSELVPRQEVEGRPGGNG